MQTVGLFLFRDSRVRKWKTRQAIFRCVRVLFSRQFLNKKDCSMRVSQGFWGTWPIWTGEQRPNILGNMKHFWGSREQKTGGKDKKSVEKTSKALIARQCLCLHVVNGSFFTVRKDFPRSLIWGMGTRSSRYCFHSCFRRWEEDLASVERNSGSV